jgi:hypothetical protein
MMAGWADPEFAVTGFGDTRLDDRYGVILGARTARPGASIPGACQTKAEAEATYRFFSNEKVTPEGILAPHVKALEHRARDFDTIVVVQDTTETDLTRPVELIGGPLDGADRRGLLNHALVAFTPNGLPLGVLAASIWQRPEPSPRARKRNDSRPIEEKESYRWVQGFQTASAFQKRLTDQTRVVVVGDSESDIYDCLAASQADGSGERGGTYFVIRACQNRSLPNEDEKLFEAVASTPVLGRYTLDVRARPAASHDNRKRKKARRARTAEMAIRAAKVRLTVPKGKKYLPAAELNAVLMREQTPPDGEDPIEWLLLTDLPIDTPEQIQDVIAFYLCRWNIEVYFRTLKGGCRIEDLQLETTQALKNCIALYMVVAWRLLYLARLKDTHPNVSCDQFFDADEWQAAYAMTQRKRPPSEPPTLREMLMMIAAMGGFHSRGKAARPGVKTMWIGLTRLKDIAFGWRLAKQGG